MKYILTIKRKYLLQVLQHGCTLKTLQQVKEKENGYQVGLSRGKNANNTTASNKVIPYSAWRSV